MVAKNSNSYVSTIIIIKLNMHSKQIYANRCQVGKNDVTFFRTNSDITPNKISRQNISFDPLAKLIFWFLPKYRKLIKILYTYLLHHKPAILQRTKRRSFRVINHCCCYANYKTTTSCSEQQTSNRSLDEFARNRTIIIKKRPVANSRRRRFMT